MASRSNSGMGVLVALVIFIMLTITLLLLLMLFYTKADRETQARQMAESKTKDFITDSEQTRDDVRRLLTDAKKDGKSVVMYLQGELSDTMRIVGGRANMTPEQLQGLLKQFNVTAGDSLTNVLAGLRTQLGDALAKEASLTTDLGTVRGQLKDQVAETDRLKDNQKKTFDTLNAQILELKDRADKYSQQVADAQKSMNDRVTDIRNQYETKVADLTHDVQTRDVQISQLQDTVERFQQKMRGSIGSSIDEGSQPDGSVARILQNQEVFIDLGSKQHVVLGMTFEVYGSVADEKPDSQGNVPAGKATIEVTKVGDTTSTCRITRSTPGQAVVQGDIIVNPVYDKNKPYTFFVFGQFDLDHENGPSDLETDIVKSRIKEWGGTLQKDFSGDVDFVVLGQNPVKPMNPRDGATPAEIIRFTRERKAYDDYQAYLDQAKRLSIPVLNQNRLLTLINYFGN